MTPKTCALLAALSLILLLVAYHTAGTDLMTAWQTDEYSHGIVIPFIALMIAWHILTATKPTIRPSWSGLPALAITGLFLLIAELAAFQTAAHYGFIIGLVGLTLAFLGKQTARVLAPAFIYLFFAIPLPNLLYSALSQHLQLISSTIGVWFLDVVGIPVYQEGNVIDLGGYKLQVVEACSGLRYLFPLMSFGYLMGYLLQDKFWKRAVLFLSAIPITIFMNSLRIAVIGVTVNLWGSSMAEGFIHEFEGWVVFLICVLILLGEVILLLKASPGGHFRYEYFGLAQGKLFTSPLTYAPPIAAALAATALLAASFGMGIISEREQVIPPHPPFSTFPKTIGSWHGAQKSMEVDILQSLQLSDYWLADYTQDDSAIVNFYIAYYDSQRVGSSTHSPSSCIPGGGWQITSNDVVPIKLGTGDKLNVSRFIIKKGDVRQLVYFWFDERGRIITETSYAKWYMLVDSITMHRTDGALVRAVTAIAKNESEEEADKRLNEFLTNAFPISRTFIPGNTLPTP